MDDVRKTLAAQSALLTELLTRAAGPTLSDYSISFSSFELLSAVRTAGQSATQVEIARRLGITPPTLTEAVRVAKNRGLLDQSRSETDSRSKCLKLTGFGEAIVQEVLEKVNQAERAMVVNIDPVALRTTVETLETANRNLARLLSDS